MTRTQVCESVQEGLLGNQDFSSKNTTRSLVSRLGPRPDIGTYVMVPICSYSTTIAEWVRNQTYGDNRFGPEFFGTHPCVSAFGYAFGLLAAAARYCCLCSLEGSQLKLFTAIMSMNTSNAADTVVLFSFAMLILKPKYYMSSSQITAPLTPCP